MTENRPLLGMALPQFAIDAAAAPRLRLVVDRADAGADLLLPMSENANVTVQTYRKLRWGGRVGLLLEAASLESRIARTTRRAPDEPGLPGRGA